VLQGIGWLLIDSPLYGPILLPFMLLGLLGPLSGSAAFFLLIVFGVKLWFWWLRMPVRTIDHLAERHARGQGRVSDRELLKTLGLGGRTQLSGIEVETGAIPLGYLNGRPIGMPWTADADHIAVVGPTRSGKGLHLMDTLIRWPRPADQRRSQG